MEALRHDGELARRLFDLIAGYCMEKQAKQIKQLRSKGDEPEFKAEDAGKITNKSEPRLPLNLRDIFKEVARGNDVRLLDLNIVRENFSELSKAFPFARCHAAVKANTAEGILEILNENGSSFEIATIEELDLCLAKGISPKKIIFSHPAKDALEIGRAYECGVRRFTTDSVEDLDLIIKHAPRSKVSVRIKTENTDKEGDRLTGFNARFGVGKETAKTLLRIANSSGVTAHGIAFHIGTQEEDPNAWNGTIELAASIFTELKSEGILLKSLNIGGG